MSYENKGSMTAVAVVTAAPDRSGNFVIEAGDDPAVVIETAWAYLNRFGGGTLITKGAGQTWTFNTELNSQGPNVTWISDWSLTFTIANGLDTNVIDANGDDNLVFNGLHVDGNKANQTTGAAASSDGIRVELGSHVKILNGWFEDCARYGIGVVGFNVLDVDVEVAGNACINAGWNGITMGFSNADPTTSRVFVHHNYVTHSSDVGITSYASYAVISNNIVEDMDGTAGSGGGAGQQTCYGIEGAGATRPTGIVFDGNIGRNSGAGVTFFVGEDSVFSNGHLQDMSAIGVHFQNGTVGCKVEGTTIAECVNPIWVVENTSETAKHQIVDNTIYNDTTAITAWNALVICRGNGTIIKDNTIWSGTSQINIYGVDINGVNENPLLDVEFVGNTIYGFDGASNICVIVRNNVDGAIIKDNSFRDSVRGISISAATEAGNIVLGNLFDNVTTPFVDSGTGTILHSIEWLATYGAGGITLAGDVPVAAITNGQSAAVGFEAPPRLQQLMYANLKVLPNATQAAADWDLNSDYGGIGEIPTIHSEADAATTYNVTNNQWYDIELVALGFFANLAVGDRGGMRITVSTAGHNTSLFSLRFDYI